MRTGDRRKAIGESRRKAKGEFSCQLPVVSCQLSVNSKLKTQNSKLYFFLALGSWLLALGCPASAQLSGGFGDAMNTPMGARTYGLGESFVGEASDINAIFWNPGGLNQLDGKHFSYMEFDLFGLGLAKYQTFAYATHQKDESEAFGIKYSQLKFNREAFDPVPFDWSEKYLVVTYTDQYSDLLSVGVNLKVMQLKFSAPDGSGDALGLGADIGALYKIDEKLKAGVMLRDLYNNTKFTDDQAKTTTEQETLPLRMSVGFSYKYDRKSILVFDVSDFNIDDDIYPLTFGFGLERWLDEQIAVRAGYIIPGVGKQIVTSGVGIKFGPWTIDYAYDPRSESNLQDVKDRQRISINFRLK